MVVFGRAYERLIEMKKAMDIYEKAVATPDC